MLSSELVLNVTVDAVPDSIVLVRHAFAGLAEGMGLGVRLAEDIKLAVSEACTNSVVHAYDGPGKLEISVSRSERKLEVIVRDFGRGIMPRLDSPGLGIGLPIIATLSDSLELRGTPGKCAEVAMTFSLDQS